MKKAITFVLCAGMVLSMAACSSSASSTPATEAAQTETAAETEEAAPQVYAHQFDVESMLELGVYKNLTYTIVDTTITDDQVDEYVKQMVESQAKPEEITDRAVEEGDTICLDYEGLRDGEAFQGGTAQGQFLTIGSGQFIPGFEEGLIGSKPGDEVALDLTFPENYGNADLAGVAVVFNCKINYIQGENIVPEFTDELVESLGIEDVKTKKDFKKWARKALEETAEQQAKSSMENELLEAVLATTTFNTYPEELVAQNTNYYINYYTTYAQYSGLELADFLTTYMNTTEEAFMEDADNYGREASEITMMLAAIVKAEGFEMTDEVYAEGFAKFAEENGYVGEEALAQFEAQYPREYIEQAIISEKAMEILKANATGVEAAEGSIEEIAETEAE